LNVAAEPQFKPEEWQRLGSSERVLRCQQFAEHARQLSSDAAPELKQGYLDLSRHWLALAEEIERHGRKSDQSSAGLQAGGS